MLFFSFFLAVSVIIWLLNALSKNYTTEIKYPITYSRFPDQKLLVSDVPDHLTLKVNAHGYALLSYKLSNRPIPINFPVTSFAMNRFAWDSSKFYMLSRYAREQVARQLPGELQLLEISPDTLIFQFAGKVSRKVPVRPVLNYEIGRGFTTKNKILITPDSVLVTGPDIFLDTMTALRTQRKDIGLLQKSYVGDLVLNRPRGFDLGTDRVSLSIELEKLTEVKLNVPIQVSGLPDSLRLQTFPQQVRITGKIGLSNYERIVPEAFRVEVGYDEVVANKERLQVYIRTKPADLSNIDFYPQFVDYFLTVK